MKMNFSRNNLTRKDFISALGRYTLLALIVFLAIFLLTNRKTTVEEECSNDFKCGNCSKHDNCNIDKDKQRERL